MPPSSRCCSAPAYIGAGRDQRPFRPRSRNTGVKTGVGIMARAPSAVGKTRLGPHVSAVRLRALRTALLADTLQALHDVPNTIVYFTPDEADPEMNRCVTRR